MIFLIASVVAAILVTILAAWLLVRRRPNRSAGAQIWGAALSFPALAIVLFVIVTAIALIGASGAPPSDGAGMAIAAMVFFLFYTLFIGAVVGIPTAIIAVRAFRRR
ncbi:hypothetical protein [Sphingomonas sp. LM7]|uniref:hypothetical protein n=1 Tax=Sphingomonas sp. LM7 TaxID=1938607 RepID=UPI00098396B0|nr:hypothetical protein [Sphingomonas sp. LM7]AQR74770.1 hypothetical protein BXU08_14900 [Sphingomonas sp. LM7]